jgi:hypothetical protein
MRGCSVWFKALGVISMLGSVSIASQLAMTASVETDSILTHHLVRFSTFI